MHEQAEIPHNTLVVVGDGRKAPGGVRSAMEQTDWHHLEKDRCVGTILAVLAREAAVDPDLRGPA
jgi:hypothetical protein